MNLAQQIPKYVRSEKVRSHTKRKLLYLVTAIFCIFFYTIWVNGSLGSTLSSYLCWYNYLNLTVMSYFTRHGFQNKKWETILQCNTETPAWLHKMVRTCSSKHILTPYTIRLLKHLIICNRHLWSHQSKKTKWTWGHPVWWICRLVQFADKGYQQPCRFVDVLFSVHQCFVDSLHFNFVLANENLHSWFQKHDGSIFLKDWNLSSNPIVLKCFRNFSM